MTIKTAVATTPRFLRPPLEPLARFRAEGVTSLVIAVVRDDEEAEDEDDDADDDDDDDDGDNEGEALMVMGEPG
jgi:hypothetical protein